MESSAGQLQEISGGNSMENMLVCSKQNQQERKPKPQQEEALKCPRCDSINTKFCYYNNYSLSQPRYFCKSCRRYWTKGGTLRNVPVGGGCRKNKRSSSSKKAQLDHQNSNPLLSSFPPLTYDSNDLTLAFARLQKQSNGDQLGFDNDFNSIMGNPNFDILGNPNQSYMYTNGYYGNLGEIENNNCGDQMMLPYDHNQDNVSSNGSNATTQAVTVTTMKQEVCNFGREDVDQSKILFGFPWNGGFGDFESAREISSWNNNIHGIGSSWHGVLNAPLM